MATYQKWDQSYTPKVQTIRLSYRGVKYNKMCDSKQSVHYSPHCPWLVLLYKSGRNSTLINKQSFNSFHIMRKIESQMNRAIVNKNDWSNSNTSVSYNESTNC